MHLTAEQLDQIRAFFAARPVKRAWLFGSYARGEADEQSDVDLLVDLDYAKHIGWSFFVWSDELREQLGLPVDVVSAASVNKYIRPFVEQDQTLIYERPT